MEYVFIFTNTKETIEDILEVLYADFVKNNLMSRFASK